MLFTRCPDCDTTFRITDAALKKAGGRVRCGRCASIFDAYAELREEQDDAAAAPAASLTPMPHAGAGEAPQAEGTTAEKSSTGSVADVVAEISVAAEQQEAAEALESEPQALSPDAIDNVLAESAPGAGAASLGAAIGWPGLEAAPRSPRSRWWGVGAALALVTLGVQAGNHYRSDLAGHATFGPWVQRAYAALGMRVTPRWDVHQYKILDWVATAEPNARGLGSLKISARIQNLSQHAQPYPSVQLRLKDRWEETVGGRLFTPTEYSSREIARDALMQPGETARAAIELVDPGPDAYGFELDVCIEMEVGSLSCGTDKVFL